MRGTIVYKMTGSGNDFVLLDGRATTPEEWPAPRVVQLCDRRTGVGADGLVILTPDQPGAVHMAFWNSDGSRAAMCGNAALCSTRLSVFLELTAPGDLRLLTDAGVVQARCPDRGDQAEIRLPDFSLADGAAPTVCGVELAPGERWMAFATVGVPHLVIRVDDIEAVDLLGRGRSLRYDRRLGAEGANVNFVRAPAGPGDPWLIRTYERGVEGETLACGTGTVAAGVALAAKGEATLPVRFRSRGGEELLVRASLTERQASDVWLGGQGKLVFRAVWEA
ncbi:MAG: diaminopimelate epimerase [Gemmatimonadales bacterium]